MKRQEERNIQIVFVNWIPFGKDHLEHKIPIFRGGSNFYENLAVACAKCNLSKHVKTEEEYGKEMAK